MRVVATIFVLAALVHPLAAQTPETSYVGWPIEQVQVLIESRPSVDPALLDLLETRVGQPLAMADVRESITHLYTLGRFEDVRVDAAPSPSGGISLRYELTPIHGVSEVEFEGALALSKGTLRRAMTERYGATPTLGRAAEVVRLFEQVYRDRGYLKPTVRAVPRQLHDPDRTVLTFEIDAGPLARIRNVEINGNPMAARTEVLGKLAANPSDPYQQTELQRRLSDYIARLKRRGYYEASATQNEQVSTDSTAVDLTLNFQPGPVVTVTYEGDRLPPERLKELVPIEREGSVDEDLLEDSAQAIRTHLHQQGYWKADATWRRLETDGKLTLAFRITAGRQYHVADFDLTGNSAMSAEEIRPLLGMKPGDLFIDSKLTTGVATVAAHYQQRGFSQVQIKTAATDKGNGLVTPVIVVVEGPRTLVGTVTIAGSSAISENEIRALIKTVEGEPFFQPRIAADRDRVVLEYLNNGFASIDVGVIPDFSADRTRVNLTFKLTEGPQTLVDHILVVGNRRTDPSVILNEIPLKPGKPLGLEDQIESQRRLSSMGLFRRVRITELRHGGTRHDVLVTVEEAAATSISYGGGVEATQRLRATGPGGEAEQHLEFAPRGFFDIGRRNVGGRNRTVDLYARVSLQPRDAPNDPSKDGTGLTIGEYRVVGTYRAPRAVFGGDATLTAAAEQGIRSSFSFTRQGLNADTVRRLTQTTRVTARYSLNSTHTFNERLSEEDQATIDRLFPRVRLSTISGAVARDTRDDVLDPERGTFLSAEASLASRALGGQVGFIKTYLQGFWFHRLPGRRRIVFASRATIGLADGFTRPGVDENGNPILIEDLPASERFFAGGDTSIRGYALDTVGAPNTITANGFPKGGNAVLILNGELRVPVWREFGTALFIDGGNVFERVTEFDLGELRGAVGFGLRYKSPLGPIRVDVGFKMDRREIGGQLEPRTAWHFSIGQAF
jgi:outer membrane protein assembly factor BamA